MPVEGLSGEESERLPWEGTGVRPGTMSGILPGGDWVRASPRLTEETIILTVTWGLSDGYSVTARVEYDWFKSMVLKLAHASGPPRGHVKAHISGLHSQSFGVGSGRRLGNLHLQPVPRWCWCREFGEHTLRTTGSVTWLLLELF